MQSCVGHGGGLYGPINDPTYVHKSSPTWEDSIDCGRNQCVTSTTPTAKGDEAFCALEATRDPVCGADDYACDGATLVKCGDGYAKTRTTCLVCDATKAAHGCSGSVFSSCASAADCAPGMTCANKRCEMPCACPEGEECSVCDAAFEEVAYETTCSGGSCFF